MFAARFQEETMNSYVLKGAFVHAPTPGALFTLPGGYLVVENGKIAALNETLEAQYAGLPLYDYSGKLIIPSFADMHLHAPQYPMLGMGMDYQLLEWLDRCTFPTEAAFSDTGFAREVYARLAAQLVEVGTTRVCMFSSVHVPATHILMEELANAGICGYVGKVNMDRNSSAALQEDTAQSLADTKAWIENCLEQNSSIRPIITPRFTPSCTDTLMQGLYELARTYNLRVQSHLSENPSEIEWVQSLTGCAQYYESYERFGLFTEGTVMAHCVFSDEVERAAMRKHGVWAAHCPDSNVNLQSGIAPVRRMLDEGVRVVLGSDIAGGAQLNMMDVTTAAIRASKQRCIDTNGQDAPLTVAEAFYLATSAGAEYFGEQPGFAPGNTLHALVVDDSALPPSKEPLSLSQRLERALYLRAKVTARFVGNKQIG